MVAERAPGASPHSWLSDFLAEPSVQVRELLLGRARIGALSGAQVPDAAQLLFGPLPVEGDERRALDHSISSFLIEERNRSDRHITRSAALACADALRLVSLLRLGSSAEALRLDMDLWLSWAEALPSANAVDVRAELFSTWALTQRFSESATLELEPFWLTICEEVGDRYPQSYLQIGLLGLRMLPERAGVQSERAWLTGLLRWAVARRPTADEFSFEWRALRSIYPRTNAYWRDLIAHTLKDAVAQNLSSEVGDRWRYDVGLTDESEGKVAPDPLWNTLGPAQEAVGLVQRLDGPLTALAPEIRTHIANRERYAEATGNYYFLVRSACHIGMRMIERGTANELEARGRLATELAVKTLHWDSTSVYGWALWRDALAASGAFEAAELVGWEAVRRFPENEQWRNQLALLLSSLGRHADSEALLLATVRRFPREAVSRTQLALLWMSSSRHAEAAEILKPGIREGFADAALYSTFGRATFELHGKEAALAVFEQGLRVFPADEALSWVKGYLLQHGRLPIQGPSALPAAVAVGADLPPATARAGRLRRIEERVRRGLASQEWRDQALREVRSELETNPHSDYGKYLLSQLDSGTPSGGFVGALWKAMELKDSAMLSAIEENLGGRKHIFDVARAFLFADKSAASRIATWLHAEGYQESRPNVALRRFLALRFGEASSQSSYTFGLEPPEHVIEVLAANDNVRWDLLEVAVASLAYPLAA